MIGETGLCEIDHFGRHCGLGIRIGRPYWGKGFGQDAVRTLVDYAVEHLNMNRVALQCLAEAPRAVGAIARSGSSRKAVSDNWHGFAAGTRTCS